jgi:hypothetical protein
MHGKVEYAALHIRNKATSSRRQQQQQNHQQLWPADISFFQLFVLVIAATSG